MVKAKITKKNWKNGENGEIVKTGINEKHNTNNTKMKYTKKPLLLTRFKSKYNKQTHKQTHKKTHKQYHNQNYNKSINAHTQKGGLFNIFRHWKNMYKFNKLIKNFESEGKDVVKVIGSYKVNAEAFKQLAESKKDNLLQQCICL